MTRYPKQLWLRFAALAALLLIGLIQSCNQTSKGDLTTTNSAFATMVNTEGQPIGRATFTKNSGGRSAAGVVTRN
jgi:hypothetical protein